MSDPKVSGVNEQGQHPWTVSVAKTVQMHPEPHKHPPTMLWHVEIQKLENLYSPDEARAFAAMINHMADLAEGRNKI